MLENTSLALRLLSHDAGNILLGVMLLAAGLCSFAVLKVFEKRRNK